ncbi:sensor domain-containing protein [Tritonibacter horizontis]|uniref:sensor domain-containing protein n=1 Tax=Tritonibacter horizontis TaxID=1768241 RepID=UPI001E534F96|nr:bifunctional diguanylate cyclase/phosphodiesterase [Tritonibacter horizontis]
MPHPPSFASQSSFDEAFLSPLPAAVNLLYVFCAGVFLFFLIAEVLKRIRRVRMKPAAISEGAGLSPEDLKSVALLDAEARVIDANPRFQKDVDLNLSQILGRPIWALHKMGFGKAFWEGVLVEAKSSGSWSGETRTLDPSGAAEAHVILVTARKDADQTATYEFHSQRQKKPEAGAEFNRKPSLHASSQAVLPNRQAMNAEIDSAIARAQSTNRSLALMVIDLDRFRDINAIFGDEVGDQVLARLARSLRSIARPNLKVGRIGDDEFILLVEHVSDPSLLSQLAEEVATALSEDVAVDGLACRLSASIGIAQFPKDGICRRSLMQAAEASLCHAKTAGRGQVSFYAEAMEQRSEKSAQLVNDLQRGIAAGELTMYYQPQVDLRTGQCVGAEALLRWQHPTKGLLLPGGFVPLAMDVGLAAAIDQFVMKEVCAQIGRWTDRGYTPMKISVNMSAISLLSPDFATDLKTATARHGVDPHSLEIEILESTIFPRMNASFELIRELHEIGISLAIDDFGTGYSSLSLLKDLPIGRLKLDRRFITNLPHNVKDDRIVAAVVAMGRSLGIDVIAEGVETRTQESRLIALGCTEAQGFLYSRPISADDLSIHWMKGSVPNACVGATT